MAAHVRTQIRLAAKAALTGLATTGASVHVNRSARLSLRQLPALVLTVEDEEVEPIGASSMLMRQLAVAVDGYASVSSGVDDLLDQIGKEVEIALVAAGTLGGLIKGPARLQQVAMGVDESLEEPLGRVRMLWRMTTTTPAAQPDTVL